MYKFYLSIHLSSISFIYFLQTHTYTRVHTHTLHKAPAQSFWVMWIYSTEVCKLQCDKSLCLSGVYNKREVRRRKECQGGQGFLGTHQPGTSPSIRKGNSHQGNSYYTQAWEVRGNPRGEGGGGASETMYYRLGKTNRLLPTKQKVPAGKSIFRSTCAWKG